MLVVDGEKQALDENDETASLSASLSANCRKEMPAVIPFDRLLPPLRMCLAVND
jgi:hypothetical protein